MIYRMNQMVRFNFRRKINCIKDSILELIIQTPNSVRIYHGSEKCVYHGCGPRNLRASEIVKLPRYVINHFSVLETLEI